MQGTWKENLSGYDRKGNLRRRHTRKHTLKDKAKALYKRSDDIPDDIVVDYSDKYENIVDTVMKNGELTNIYRIRVERIYGYYTSPYANILSPLYSYSVKTGYLFDNYWRDWIDDSIICPIKRGTALAKIDQKFIEYTESRSSQQQLFSFSKFRGPLFCRGTSRDLYIYGKPMLEKFFSLYWRGSHPRRKKFLKRFIHKIVRHRAKEWIKKDEFDRSFPKNHALEKSIAWELH